ncbi:MAG: TraR/DksA C4-type zinc finger protein [Acidimicrobiia bacterium]|nr:TraR/DksA C4-type zinc finger protein [Acidimicrobiia bacterium]MDX2467921.1 TraR/DksA C4-type zinc finger protein [Acidimicrobiia bacterium]
MTRDLAKSTLERLRRHLDDEETRLIGIIEEYDKVFTEVNMGSTSAEHSADPNSADGGALALELEMDLSVLENARELLSKVQAAQRRMEKGTYGKCVVSGKAIPVERLEALPYATTLVEYADRV